VCVPNRSTKSAERKREQKKRWFRSGQKWRTGCEGRISVTKRRHGLNRCRYRGDNGMKRWVGLDVIADNLINIGRAIAKQTAQAEHTSRFFDFCLRPAITRKIRSPSVFQALNLIVISVEGVTWLRFRISISDVSITPVSKPKGMEPGDTGSLVVRVQSRIDRPRRSIPAGATAEV
jgi:Transposase DDE domain